MQSDLLLPADDVASLRSIQYQRDRLGLLHPTANAAIWQPVDGGQAQDFWRTLCEKHLKSQDKEAHEAVLTRLKNLACALQTSVNDSGRGQPPLLRTTFKNLARLPAFKQAKNALTAEQWAMLAYAQALRALLELASLVGTHTVEKPAQEVEFTLRDAFERATQGIEVQVSAGLLPTDTYAVASDDGWAHAQRQAKLWLQHPDFFNKTGWHLPQYVMRSLVEFIVAYSDLFEEIDSTGQKESDDWENKNNSVDDSDEETSEDDNEHAGKNTDTDHTGNDVATKIIGLSEKGRSLLHSSMGTDVPRAIPGNHPMLVPPRPWKHLQRGGHLASAAHLCKSKAKNAPEADIQQLMGNSDMPRVFNALNQLQNTAWRINQSVLRTSQAIYGDSAEQDCSPYILQLRREAQKNPIVIPKNKKVPKKESKPFRGRPGSAEWLQKTRLDRNSSQWEIELGDLEKRDAFWYPYQLDFRGRIYPQAGWLSPQGDDLAKGLLEFAKGKTVPTEDAEARKFLAIYGAQLAANTGINTPSLDAYAQWIEANRTNIMASVENPLQNTWWLEHAKSGSRWQMLAFCFAWVDMEAGKPVHLPVQVDGSCNGLQHMAALLRDKKLATHTNLLGTDEKNDLYSWILQGVKADIERISQDTSKGEHPLAAWVDTHGQNILNRDIAKKVVMTFSYGSTRYKDSLTEFLLEQSVFALPATEVPDQVFPESAIAWLTALVDSQKNDYPFPHAIRIPGWDQTKPKKNQIPSSRLNDEELQTILIAIKQQQPVKEDLQNKTTRFLRDRLASFLTERFQSVMEDQLQNAVTLQKLLQTWSMKTTQATGLAPIWISPVDFPVIQHKKTNKKRQQDTSNAKKTRVDADVEKPDVVLDWTAFGLLCEKLPPDMNMAIDLKGTDGRRQIPREQIPFFVTKPEAHKSAFPPNFIHSLDAAHLMLTLNRCQQLGIEDFVAVHDSFGTHACDVAKLARALRDSFMHMHSQPLLDQYHAWLQYLMVLANPPQANTTVPTPPANDHDMHAAVIGLVRHHWLALRPCASAASSPQAQPKPLPLPPTLPTEDRFDIDAIGKSDYIFF